MASYEHTKAEVRIRAAMSQMPYGGLEDVAKFTRRVGLRDGRAVPVDLDDVGAYLEALSETLQSEGRVTDREHRRLVQLQADVEAVRRVFGYPAK